MKSVLTQKRELEAKGWVYALNDCGCHTFKSPDGKALISHKDFQVAVDKAAIYDMVQKPAADAPNPAIPAIVPNDVANEPLAIVDLLKAKNDEIEALKAEIARMKALINECEQAIRAGFSAIAELSHAPYLDVSEQKALMNRVHDNLYDFNQALQAPAAAPQAEAVTKAQPKYKVNDLVLLPSSDWPYRIVKVYVSTEQGKIEYMVENMSKWYQESELQPFRIFDSSNEGA